jgi:hypothetical protein
MKLAGLEAEGIQMNFSGSGNFEVDEDMQKRKQFVLMVQEM